MNNKFASLTKPDNFKFFLVIAFLVIMLWSYSPLLGGIGAAMLAFLAVTNHMSVKKTKSELVRVFEEVSTDLDSAGRSSILNVPVPVTLVDNDGKVTWYNSKFSDLVSDMEVIGVDVEEIIPGIKMDMIRENTDLGEIKYKDKRFKVYHSTSSSDDDGRNITILYWYDITKESLMRQLYEESRPIVALIQIDNYDDVLAETKDEKRPLILTDVDNKLTLWAQRMNAMVKKYSRDKYVVVFEMKHLEVHEQKRFSILDDVREIDNGNKIPMTLSIGVGASGKTLSDIEESAFSALELALGRGGDQAVVRKKGNFEFYGGKSKAVEKRNRVKARIIAHAFRPLIDESSKVFIMGHKVPDMDAFGAAIGVYRAVISRGKEAYIILDSVNEQIKNVYSSFAKESLYRFITGEEAKQMTDVNSMLVIVDTHKPSLTICPELVDQVERKVLFDHHRLGTEFVENTELKYLEPYASSTCELVTEILPYMGSAVQVEKIEAEALLAGIMLDTKSFSFKTGVRTFEAASLLRRYGADSTAVKSLFKDDLSTFIARTNLVSGAMIYGSEIAISICTEMIKNIQLVAAQAADDLLNIKGINTSFVIGQNDDGTTIISGRSFGDTNVQIILEKLGGGGHMSIAGAQIKGGNPQTVAKMLKAAIDEYFEENPDIKH